MKRLLLLITIAFISINFSFGEKPRLQKEINRFEAADKAFFERADEFQARKALKLYRELYQKLPDNCEACWRLSMTCYFVGFEFTQDKDEKKKLFTEGKDAGLCAIKNNPGCAASYFWTAINMALYGESAGPFKMVFTLPTIVKYLKTTIELDPSYAYGGAYRVLGSIEENLPGILGGSPKTAKIYYEKAIETVPNEPLNYFFLANLLEKRFNDKDASLEVAYQGLKVPPVSSDRFESIRALNDLREFIAGNTQD